MDEVKRIVKDIKQGNIKPVYFLTGEEPYYIDKISEFIENNILREEEKSFDQTVMYGRDVTVENIIATAKRFPMTAGHQVVVVREAQELSRSIEKLVPYIEKPQTSTVLVICYKYKKIDRRKKLYKAIASNGIFFESKKLYENQLADWIRRVLAGKSYTITPKAAQMLVEFLGTDLSKMSNELEKLRLAVPEGNEISPELIEKNIGISKDYNNFELRKAIGEKNIEKANRISNYFAQNPKEHPLVVTISLLHNFFVQLLQYHGLGNVSSQTIAKALRVNPFFVKEYQQAASNYPMRKVSQIISELRQADIKSKGIGGAGIAQGDIMKELIYKIMH